MVSMFDLILRIIPNGNKPIRFNSVSIEKDLFFKTIVLPSESRRRLINIVCSNKGVWAIDDQGHIYFRHGHISASQQVQTYGATFLPPAWIQAPGEAERRRSFTQIYCGPADWMVIVEMDAFCKITFFTGLCNG